MRGLLIDSLRQTISPVELGTLDDCLNLMHCRDLDMIHLSSGDLIMDADTSQWRYGFKYDGLFITGCAVLLGETINVEWRYYAR